MELSPVWVLDGVANWALVIVKLVFAVNVLIYSAPKLVDPATLVLVISI